MDAIETIMTRRSIRKYTAQPISDDDIKKILRAGMSGPSCVNARDWSFIVVKDRKRLEEMAEANGRPADPLRQATVGILICGDLERAFQGAKDYWVIDGAIAAQNMILCAHALGIGSVWLGTWPEMDRVRRQTALFNLPGYIVPHSVLAFGYPAEAVRPRQEVYDVSRVHLENW